MKGVCLGAFSLLILVTGSSCNQTRYSYIGRAKSNQVPEHVTAKPKRPKTEVGFAEKLQTKETIAEIEEKQVPGTDIKAGTQVCVGAPGKPADQALNKQGIRLQTSHNPLQPQLTGKMKSKFKSSLKTRFDEREDEIYDKILKVLIYVSVIIVSIYLVNEIGLAAIGILLLAIAIFLTVKYVQKHSEQESDIKV